MDIAEISDSVCASRRELVRVPVLGRWVGVHIYETVFWRWIYISLGLGIETVSVWFTVSTGKALVLVYASTEMGENIT